MPTWTGFLYLAMVLDAYRRRIVGWSMTTHLRTAHSQSEARIAILRYIEGWYNPHRRHSALGQRSPLTYERVMPLRSPQAA